MDILNAELKWVEDRCYRVLRIQDSMEEHDLKNSTYFQEEDDHRDDYDPDLAIKHQGDKFFIAIQCPPVLIKHVCGKKWANLSLIQKEGASVKIPQKQQITATEIVISGSTKKVVSDAYRRIENYINMGRLRTEATHFISLPVNTPEIQKSFLKFKDEILSKYNGRKGVDGTIFQNPAKLHVTIALLVLLDERDRENAIALLKDCTDNILKQLDVKQFVLQVKGIEYMNDDPSEVDVLYAKLKELDDDNRLQIIANAIMNKFVGANLSKKEYEGVKLHITIMNTLFRDNFDEGGKTLRTTFDARPILKEYEEHNFGTIIVNEIHISIRYSTGKNGYYDTCHILKLNL